MGAAGEHLTLFSLTRSSISEWSIWNMLLMLCSELAGLLVPREPEMLPTLPLDDPDLTLQTDDAGIFAVNGLKLLGTFRRISCTFAKIFYQKSYLNLATYDLDG